MLSIYLLSFSLAWLPVTQQADPMEVKRTIELEAAPAKRLLPKLGEAYGVRLRAEGQTVDDVLVISVKDVTLKELMKRIARVDCAKWEKAKDGTYELIREADQKREQEKKDLAKETEYIRQMLDAYRAHLDPNSKFTLEEAKNLLQRIHILDAEIEKKPRGVYTEETIGMMNERDMLKEQLPLTRLAQRLFLALDPTFIASLPFESETIITDKPNREQTKLPLDITRFYSGFLVDHQLFFGATDKKVRVDDPSRIVDDTIGRFTHQEFPAKTILRVQKSEWGMMYLTLILLVRDVGVEQAFADPYRPMVTEKVKAPKDSKPLIDLLKGPARRFADEYLHARASEGKNKKSLDLELKSLIDAPTTHEPLSLTTGATLMASLQEKPANLVASLSDDVSYFFSFRGKPKMTAFEARQALSTTFYEFVESDGWLEITPRYPSTAWKRRVDRKTIAAIVEASERGDTSVETLSRLAVQLKPVTDKTLVDVLTHISSNRAEFVDKLYMNYQALRFYGSLLPRQKDYMSNGGTLYVKDLNADQVAALHDWVYRRANHLEFRPPENAGNVPTPIGYFFIEPTEILTTGLVPDASIQMKIENQRVMQGFLGNKPLDGFITPSDLAMRVHYSKTGGEAAEVFPLPTGYRLWSKRKITFDFDFKSWIYATLTFDDGSQMTSDQILSFSELPQDILKEVERIEKSTSYEFGSGRRGDKVNL